MTELIENTHYELIPADDDRWLVRLLEGDYPETVIEFGRVRIDTEKDLLLFDFDVQYSPDPELTADCCDLQEYVSLVLGSLLTQSFKDGSYILNNGEDSGDQLTTDDSTQSID